MHISVKAQDITTVHCAKCVLINAANTSMRGGGGVDGAIHKAAGTKLLEELVSNAPNGVKTTECVKTGGYDLADVIVHCAGPNFSAIPNVDSTQAKDLLKKTYSNAFREGLDKGITKFITPVISGAIFRGRFSEKEIVQFTMAALKELKSDMPEVEEVEFYVLPGSPYLELLGVYTQRDEL